MLIDLHLKCLFFVGVKRTRIKTINMDLPIKTNG